MASLFVIRGSDQGSRHELRDQLARLGRDCSNAIQVHDTEVSRQHAEFRFAESGYTIADLKSSNGTFVNGKRVDRRQKLHSGDQIQVGTTLMLYTGPSGDSEEDLASAVDISSAELAGDRSQIIHSVSYEEGSRVFKLAEGSPRDSWLARARSNLQVMYRTALAVSHTLDIDQLLHRIMDLIFEWVEADRGCIMLVSPENGTLVPKVLRTRKGVGTEARLQISETILDYVRKRNEGVLTSDAKDDERWSPAASIVHAGIREAICVPMQARYDMVGVIYIDTSTPPEKVIRKEKSTKFTEDHLKLMIAIAHQAALAVEDTRYYSAMVQAERLAAIGQTIATLSHHIKNILQGIRGGSYLIELGLSQDDQAVVRRGWKIVDKNQHKISSLVMDMLTFSKEREPDLVPADMNQVVADVIELMQSRAADLDVRLHWQPAEAMPELVFDPEGMHRAVLNVVTNAVDVACEKDEPGRVEVRTEHSAAEGVVRVVIEDDGPGIPSEEIDDLFRPFVSSKRGRGTGLGLPVSQKIVHEHGGKILVQSTPGQGSRFTLQLPALPLDSIPETSAS